MVAAMGELGHDVTLFTPWHDGRARDLARLRSEFALNGRFTLRYLPFIAMGERLRGSYFAIAAAAARLQRALIYTRNVRIGALAAHLGCRVIVESHNPLNSPRQMAAARELAASRCLARWVFISDRLRQLVATQVSLPADRCLVAHGAVDLERFVPAIDRATARQRLGLDPRVPLVVHAGHMYEGRGIEQLIEATMAIPDVRLFLVGGTAADVARVRARAGARVSVLGHRPLAELPNFLFAADVLAMPYTTGTTTSDRVTRSIEWASPSKLFEYLAAGRPIVSSRFPALTEVLIDGENARLVDPDRTDELRDALASLIADPVTAARLAARARADAEAHTWRARAQRVLSGL
ncbi:MAG TPA: glycosyltransferase [Kofleriaceae bacterium]|nr:glycosyltransferase [Kofleriaceae bacterium]